MLFWHTAFFYAISCYDGQLNAQYYLERSYGCLKGMHLMTNKSFNGLLITLCSIALLSLAACSIGPRQIGLTQQAWQQLNKQQQKQHIQRYEELHNYFMHQAVTGKEKGPAIKVSIYYAKAMFPPFEKALYIKPASIIMPDGSCRKLQLIASESRERRKTKLSLCYIKNLLSLDPSYIDENKKQGTLFINHHPVWVQGVTYNNLQSKGYVRLQNCALRIKIVKNLTPNK
jgi:hypothetical protein